MISQIKMAVFFLVLILWKTIEEEFVNIGRDNEFILIKLINQFYFFFNLIYHKMHILLFLNKLNILI